MKVTQLSREDLLNTLNILEHSGNLKRISKIIHFFSDELKSREVTYYELNSDNIIRFSPGFNADTDFLISVERLTVINAIRFVTEHEGIHTVSIEACSDISMITVKLLVTEHSVIANLNFKNGGDSDYDLTTFFI